VARKESLRKVFYFLHLINLIEDFMIWELIIIHDHKKILSKKLFAGNTNLNNGKLTSMHSNNTTIVCLFKNIFLYKFVLWLDVQKKVEVWKVLSFHLKFRSFSSINKNYQLFQPYLPNY